MKERLTQYRTRRRQLRSTYSLSSRTGRYRSSWLRSAPYFNNARLLIAADCTAYAYANFHQEFLKGKVALIGCPKLDDVDYSEKLTEIIKSNEIQSVTIVRMEVPCCGGLQNAAIRALRTVENSFRGRL